MHNVLFFQFFFSLEFSFCCGCSWSCLSPYVLTILVFVEFISLITKLYFWYSYSVSWAIIQTREGWALAPTPWAKICSKKRVWTPVSMKQTNKRPNLIRLWHLPLPAMSFTEAVKLQLPLLLHHLLHIHRGEVPLKKCPPKMPDVLCIFHCLLASAHTCQQGDGHIARPLAVPQAHVKELCPTRNSSKEPEHEMPEWFIKIRWLKLLNLWNMHSFWWLQCYLYKFVKNHLGKHWVYTTA